MTYYVLLLSALAVAGLGCWVRRRFGSLGSVMVMIGCAGCVACIGWQVRENLFTPPAPAPDRGQAVVGYFLANYVLNEIGDRQGQVILIFPPESVIDEETTGTYAGTFGRVLRGFPGLAVEVIRLAAPGKESKAGKIPLEAFRQVTTNRPQALAYVSFAGVPADLEKLPPATQARGVGFFVFDPWATTNWLAPLRKGRVRRIIVPRPGVRRVAGSDIAGEPNEVFNALYLQATPATAEKIASQLGVK